MNLPLRLTLGVVLASVAFSVSSISQSIEPRRVEKNTRLTMDLETPLNSAITREGDTILLRTRNDIRVKQQVAIPRGTTIRASAIRVKPAFVNGKSKHAELHIRIDEVVLADGSGLRVTTNVLKLETEEIGQSTLKGIESVARQSVSNAIIGGVLGGRTGARVGVLGGIGIGAVGIATRKKAVGTDVDLPQGAILEVSLTDKLDIPNPTLFVSPALAANPSPTRPIPTGTIDNVNTPAVPVPDKTSASVPTFDLDSSQPPAAVLQPSADSPPAKTPGVFTLSVNVKLVQVDAVVRDRAGKPLTALQKDDFLVFDDGDLQPVQHFSRDELPLAVALVIDRSGSVAPIMDRIQSAAFKALQQLKRDDQVALFSFAGNVELLEPLTTNRQRVADRIGDITAGGGTRIFDAIDEALHYLQRGAEDRRRAIILISDNLEIDSHTDVNTVIQNGLKTDAVIYSIRIREDAPRASVAPVLTLPPIRTPRLPGFDRVERLAYETGGEIFDAKSSALDSVLATAMTRLKLRYTLGYAPPGNASPGRYHNVEVRLADRFGSPGANYSILSRRGYYE